MSTPVREALLSMGYRESEPGRWVKPVGFHAFTFVERTKVWVNWFKDKTDTLSRWETHMLNEDSPPLGQLKQFEAWTRINIPGEDRAEFELSAIDL